VVLYWRNECSDVNVGDKEIVIERLVSSKAVNMNNASSTEEVVSLYIPFSE
jgi:hypothetical protein